MYRIQFSKHILEMTRPHAADMPIKNFILDIQKQLSEWLPQLSDN